MPVTSYVVPTSEVLITPIIMSTLMIQPAFVIESVSIAFIILVASP